MYLMKSLHIVKIELGKLGILLLKKINSSILEYLKFFLIFNADYRI